MKYQWNFEQKEQLEESHFLISIYITKLQYSKQ